jgi:hypothetical protein
MSTTDLYLVLLFARVQHTLEDRKFKAFQYVYKSTSRKLLLPTSASGYTETRLYVLLMETCFKHGKRFDTFTRGLQNMFKLKMNLHASVYMFEYFFYDLRFNCTSAIREKTTRVLLKLRLGHYIYIYIYTSSLRNVEFVSEKLMDSMTKQVT